MAKVRMVRETRLTQRNRVQLPANVVGELGWQRGDQLQVETIGHEIVVLVRRPTDWVEAFAGKLTDVFGTHEENLAWIEAERESWRE